MPPPFTPVAQWLELRSLVTEPLLLGDDGRCRSLPLDGYAALTMSSSAVSSAARLFVQASGGATVEFDSEVAGVVSYGLKDLGAYAEASVERFAAVLAAGELSIRFCPPCSETNYTLSLTLRDLSWAPAVTKTPPYIATYDAAGHLVMQSDYGVVTRLLYEYSTLRLSLRGALRHGIHDAPADEDALGCASADGGLVPSHDVIVIVEITHEPNPRAADTAARCSHRYEARAVTGGSYAIEVAVPGCEADVVVRYRDARQVPRKRNACSLSPPLLRTQRRTIGWPMTLPRATALGESPPELWLSTVVLLPSCLEPSGGLSGVVYSVLQSRHADVAAAGAMSVKLTAGLGEGERVVATVETGEGGSFQVWVALPPGMYTVVVESALPWLRVARHSFHVMYNDRDLRLGVLPLPTVDEDAYVGLTETVERDETSYMLLRWNGTTGLERLELLLGFGAMGGGGARCQVGRHGATACGGARWEAAAAQNGTQLIAISKWQPSAYELFVSAPLPYCRGMRLRSSPHLPGGAGEVDCVGDCTTGRGYCYATPGGLCANCVLWDPDEEAGEVSCYAHGRPQGGPVPGTAEWDNGERMGLSYGTCRADFDAAAVEPSPPLCVRDAAVDVSVQLIDGKQGTTHTSWLPPVTRDAFAVDPVPAAIAGVMCVDPRQAPGTSNAPRLALPKPCDLEPKRRGKGRGVGWSVCCADLTPSENNARIRPATLNGTELFSRLVAGGVCESV